MSASEETAQANIKLAGREQLATQGVSGRQVHKGVAGVSQRRGSVASFLLPASGQRKSRKPFLISCQGGVAGIHFKSSGQGGPMMDSSINGNYIALPI
ncbi:hypothetical protein FYJ39_02660 [Clostridium sp. WCA-389-WT-23D1]|uniref:Uncharacterized protein n=1 Tax=Clostridium porci TaxID=2605778 RepID=A0A7X2NIV7_9CLOT|nr:hypothetical protein [Clostridium porci]